MAARSKGLGKKALAAWVSWWSAKTRRARVGFPRRVADGPPHVQLVLEPQGHGQAEAAEAGGGIGEVGLEEAFELGERLVVEGDVVEFVGGEACLAQAIGDGLGREGRIVLDPGESLLLGGGDDPAVDDEGGGAIMIECGETQDRRHVPPHGLRFIQARSRDKPGQGNGPESLPDPRQEPGFPGIRPGTDREDP